MTINTTYNNNSILRTNLDQKNSMGRRFLNKLQILPNNKGSDILGINNYSNRRHNYESELFNNIVKTEPSTEYMNKINNINNSKINSNNLQFNRLNRGSFPKKANYNNPGSYLSYLQSIRKEPNYNITKNKNNNLIKNIQNKDILKTGTINNNRRYIIPRNSDALSTSKKNPFVTIRNTVINFNMIEPGLILPSFNKKSQDKRKYNMIGPYNTQNQINPTKKYSRETINTYNTKNYNNSINRFSSINNNNSSFKPLFKNKTINSNHSNNHSLSINHNTLINRDLLYSGNGRFKIQTQENKISAISSFNKLVNKMKNKQLYNKISNSVEKNHLKFKSMKLNDLLYRNKQKSEKKSLELTGINNAINNSNKFKSINATPNFTLPSLIIKKRKGYLMQPHGKTLKLINPLQQNTFTENYNRPSYIKNLGIKI